MILRALAALLLLCGIAHAQAVGRIGPPTLAGANVWTGPNNSPACALSTSGAVVAINLTGCVASNLDGIDLGTITLTQNSSFAFPTGLPTGGNLKFGFRINHGSGPFTAQFENGYTFPNAAYTNFSTSGGQPVLSGSGTDYVWCVSEEGSPPNTVDCPGLGLQMTAVQPFTITAHDPGTTCSSGGTTCSTNSINVTSGDYAVVMVIYCNTSDSGCAGSLGSTIVSSITKASGTGTIGTPHQMTGVAGSHSAAEFEFIDVWLVPITGTGSLVLTANISSTSNQFPRVAIFDVAGLAASSPDDGIGAHASISTTTLSATTSSTTTQTGEFVLAVGGQATGPSTVLTPSTGYTVIENTVSNLTIPFITQWTVSGNSGTSPTFSSASTATGGEAAIMTFKHP